MINEAQKASAVRSSQTRAVIAAVAVGVLLTIGLAALVERLTTQRREPDQPDEGEDEDEDGHPDGDADPEGDGADDADLSQVQRKRLNGRGVRSDIPPRDHLEPTS